ncbi:MAG: KamA family radical SAM protein [Deltaproteobacteria bacterium]|nr:KamA family radical SAM protein [Deltaproteobacteria bacterium]MBM4324424.1 KamA family radical SAM protein [Deltaproteobacteria bacterium]
MEQWQRTLSESITSLDELARFFPIDIESLRPVIVRYPLRITHYYLNLIQERDDPIGRQCIPDQRELMQDNLSIDPLNEGNLTFAPGLIHRYPDRVVLLVSSSCPTLCRFCTRKNRMAEESLINQKSLKTALEYIEERPAIREVILSGGDPLLLTDDELEMILNRLRKITHLEIIRLHTRAPVTLPDRITQHLSQMLKQYHPLYVNTQFNHPKEITPLSAKACARLADAGIPLGNQTVLLKGVNDDLEVMKQLMQKLLSIRVRPYYIHQVDLVKGTGHFRTPIQKGRDIMAGLRGHTSGMATPSYVIDLPGGKGKVPFLPDDVKRQGNIFYLRNYLGEVVEYPDTDE